jgi:molybdopterin-guanine dinucleotide biosynthesis protein A
MTAGVILAGGQSSRMGRDKAWLLINGEPLLTRTARILNGVCDHVIVSAAAGQRLPALPDTVPVVRDARHGEGPLAGFENVLASIPERVDRVIVVACDLPDLNAPFLRWLQNQLDEGVDASVVEVEGESYPLCGVYSPAVFPHVKSIVGNGHRRFRDLLERVNTRRMAMAEIPQPLREPPPWVGVNTPDEWAARGQA